MVWLFTSARGQSVAKDKVCKKCELPPFYDGAPEDRQYCLCELESPAKLEPCRKCGNPNGYDAFCREMDPDMYYHCGKCGERENPIEPTPKSEVSPYRVEAGQNDLFQVWVIKGPFVPFGMKDWPSEIAARDGCKELNTIYAQGLSASAREIEALKKDRDKFKQEMGDCRNELVVLGAERNKLKANWDEVLKQLGYMVRYAWECVDGNDDANKDPIEEAEAVLNRCLGKKD